MSAEHAPLNVAVIGCGALAQMTHLPNAVASPRLNLRTVCDLDEKARLACAEKFGAERHTADYRAAIDDPAIDLVVIATTERFRLPPIEAAAAAKKPVYVEKPLGLSMEQVRHIQKVVEEAGIPFCVGHNRRSSPAMLDAHRIFRAHMTDPKPCPWRWDREPEGRAPLEENGTPSMGVRINDDWYSWKSWVFDPTQAPHGPMLFEMTHFTDLCNWMLDDQPVEVTAFESGMLNSAVIIRYAGGALATIQICANGTFGYPKELYEIMGNAGIVVVDHMIEVRTAGIEGAPPHIDYPLIGDRYPQVGTEGGLRGYLAKQRAACDLAARTGDPLKTVKLGTVDKGHAHQLHRFADEILGLGPKVCPVEDAVLATQVAFAAIESARQHRPVRLEEI